MREYGEIYQTTAARRHRACHDVFVTSNPNDISGQTCLSRDYPRHAIVITLNFDGSQEQPPSSHTAPSSHMTVTILNFDMNG